MHVRATRPEDITAEVIERFADCDDDRLREIMQSLVRHLHAFAIEVELPQEEWEAAIRILTETGHITDDRRQEFVLWSDALGLSMLVDAIAHARPEGATESTVLGPFYVPGSPLREYGASIADRAGGPPGLGARPRARPGRRADRRSRGRRLAERRQRAVRRAGRRGARRITCAVAS